MAAENQQKHLEFTFFIKALPFPRELAYVRTNTSFPILLSCTVKTRRMKLLYFRNETCFGAGNLYKDLLSIHPQPSVNTN